MSPSPYESLSRRHFLKVGAAAVASATLRVAGIARGDVKKDPFGGFRLGAQSYTFRHFDTEPTLKRIQELGLHYVEFYQKHAPSDATPEQNQALLRLCKQYDITPVAWGVQGFDKNHDKNKRYFEFGKALGVRCISADPSPDSFDSLDKLCEEYKIAIGIHPHGPQGKTLHRWYSAEVIMAAVKDHHPLIGACLDTGHLIKVVQLGKKLDPAEQVRIMGARNFGIHLKDHDNKAHEDVVFGKGELDVPAVLKALQEVNFQGHLSIEYEAHESEPSPDVKACVEVFKESIKHIA